MFYLQEGYNARTNRALRQVHPSPGILLCHVRSEIKLAEQVIAQARVGIEKPRAQPKYKTLAKRRLQMKKMYLAEKRTGNPDMNSFLANMGHNLMSSLFCGKSNELKKTVNPRTSLIFENNHDVSTWVPEIENDLSVLEQEDNPYSHRIVGQTRRRQEHEEIISRIPWLGKKCPSCNNGFNRTSNLVQCHSCDSFTHKKNSCLVLANDDTIFHCKRCKTPTEKPNQPKHTGSFDCIFCIFKSSTKFNLQRHVIRKHADEDNSPPSESEPTREQPEEADSHPREMNTITLETVLSDAGVPNLMDKFVNEGIDIKLLLDLALDYIRRYKL